MCLCKRLGQLRCGSRTAVMRSNSTACSSDLSSKNLRTNPGCPTRIPRTHTGRTVGRRTESDNAVRNPTEHNEQLKPTWAQRRPGRGLHAAERMGEAQNPGPDKRTLQWEGIDKTPFTTHEGREEPICCTKNSKTEGTDGPQQRQRDTVLNAYSG